MKQNDNPNLWRGFRSVVFKRPIKLVIGAFAYIRLMSRKEKTHYLILTRALGDSICALAYLNEYKKQRGYEHVTIICTKNVKRVCEFWNSAYDNLICTDQKTIIGLNEIPRTIWGQQLYTFNHRNRITFALHICNVIQRNYYWNTAYSLLQFVKDLLFQINSDSEIQYPCIPHINIQELVEKYGIQRNTTVLLNPFANSIKCDVSGMFEKTADILALNGFRVFTLTSSEKDVPIRGTTPILCDLVEAYRLAEYCGTIIALRSGFLDLMVFAKCKIISVVDKKYGPKDFYKLEKWGVNQDCYTVEYGSNDQEVIQQITNIMHLDVKGT